MNTIKRIHPGFLVAVALAFALVLAGCGDKSETAPAPAETPIPAYGPDVTMTLPDTLTGGTGLAPASATLPSGLAPMTRGLANGAIQPMAGGGDSCNFLGHGNGDPFENGHKMTKFLVGAVASWTCITRNIIRFIDFLVFLGVPTDGTPLDLVDANHQAGDPTWLSVEELSADVTVVMLYWTEDHVSPVPGDEGFYLTWDTTGGVLAGKLVVDVAMISNDPGDPPYDPVNDPAFLRLDFTRNATQKTGDLYLGFSGSHPWVTSSGWRINVLKNLDGTTPKYTAMGVIDMTAQWDPTYAYADSPQLKSFAVADSIGVGAAEASMVDMGLVLYPVDFDLDHLGTFLFTKDDRYYFGGGSPVVFKDVTLAAYKGDRAIGVGGGITSPADVDTYLTGFGGMTGSEYGICTGTPGTSAQCVTFLNAIFSTGDFGAEANVGTQPAPGDPRRDALDGATYYNSACPDNNIDPLSCTWSDIPGGVFEMTSGAPVP